MVFFCIYFSQKFVQKFGIFPIPKFYSERTTPMDYDHVFPDTNILMHHCQELYALHDKIYICGIVLEELDRLKESSDAEKAYLARTAAMNERM